MTEDRYTVELGTDDSFLLVDRGEERDQRVAFERIDEEEEARLHARTLSSMEDAISKNARTEADEDPWWSEVMAAADRLEARLPSYNHLLP